MLMGRVGKDVQADQLRQLLHDEGVNCEALLEHPTLPTISKARIVARQQQVVRVDREKIVHLSAEETVELEHRLRAAGPLLDAIVIEDYGKGLVTDALVEAVVRVAKEFQILVTVDPSPRNPVHWDGVDLVKPNRSEAFAAAGIEDHHLPVPPTENEELLRVGEILLGKWNVPRVLVTLGEQGMMLFQREGARHHIPTRAREVFDVSGAGDTAIALLTLALASGASAEQAADVANHASGIVVGKLGTARLTPEELLAAYAN
jgi:D-beta-D-heptose 7-phosphate kinase/D-beta-D-heptose 1-phosphate adenosyltransferase